MKNFIPLMVPDIRQEDIERVSSVLKSGMLVQGKQVAELENKIAEYIGVKHAIAVSNGTASLHLTLLALNIGSGDEVIVPSFSFIATANVVELVGAKPIFADIDINTCNINTQKIENVITSRTKAIIPVHEFGLCCDIEEICQLAEKHKLHVIEDAACALGSSSTQGFAGSFGTAGSFSFHPRKAITSGEGGMIVTNYPELAARLRALRNHGIDPTNAKMDFIAAGYNYRLTDIQAALVLSQFERLGSILKRRDEISRIYFNELRNVSGILLPKVPVGKKHSWQSFHIIIEGTNARDTIINRLKENNIGSNYGAQCIPCQNFYLNKYKKNCMEEFPNSHLAFRNGLVLPLYEKLSDEDIKYICDTLKQVLN